jgi:hypothetical protein
LFEQTYAAVMVASVKSGERASFGTQHVVGFNHGGTVRVALDHERLGLTIADTIQKHTVYVIRAHARNRGISHNGRQGHHQQQSNEYSGHGGNLCLPNTHAAKGNFSLTF